MGRKSFEIREYFKDNIELENRILTCETAAEIIREIIKSNYFKNINKDILILNDNNQYRNEIVKGDKAYELNVNLKIDLALREVPMKNILSRNSHRHNYVEFIYVYEGKYSQEINGEIVTIRTGECCILNPNVKHKDKVVTMEDTVLFISLSNKFFNQYLKEYIKENNIMDKFINERDNNRRLINQYIIFRNNTSENCNHIVSSIVHEFFNRDIGSKYILLGYLIRFLDLLIRKYDKNEIVKFERNKENILFEKIEEYIEKNISNISRAKIAEDLHYNSNYINTIIKKNIGLTYSEYVADKRLEIAIRWLKDSDMSINNIIKEVGYINKSYFYKIFIAKYGMKPKEFRVRVR